MTYKSLLFSIFSQKIFTFDQEEDGFFKTSSIGQYRKGSDEIGCSFGFSDPFQFLSDEGVLEARKILNKLKEDAKSNGRSLCVRGIWHISPFFKVRVGHFARP